MSREFVRKSTKDKQILRGNYKDTAIRMKRALNKKPGILPMSREFVRKKTRTGRKFFVGNFVKYDELSTKTRGF